MKTRKMINNPILLKIASKPRLNFVFKELHRFDQIKIWFEYGSKNNYKTKSLNLVSRESDYAQGRGQ